MKNEQILLVVPGTEGQVTLLGGTPIMTLIITDKHIVAGKVGSSGVRSGIAESIAKGLHKKLMNHDKYDDMEVEEIVRADKHNFAFPYDELKEIVVKKPFASKPVLGLVTHKGKRVRLVLPKESFPQVREVLAKQAPDIVKT